MEKQYIVNKETGKLELHNFSKEEYMALSEAEKKEIKRHFLFSGKQSAWISRSKHHHHFAIETAKKFGFVDGGKIGERLSYQEELERKAEKAEVRAERYEQYADNAENRARNMQKEFNSYHGDIAFFTQPNVNSSAGRAFTNRRNKILDRYAKGFEEYRKGEYFKERAKTAQNTADMKQFKNPVYLNNRIEECNKNIRALERNIIKAEQYIYEGKPYEGYLEELLDKMEYEIDKLAYLQNCMDEVNNLLKEHGKKIYTKEDIKPGYYIRTRYENWAEVLRVNSKTMTAKYIEHPLKGFVCSPVYAEIREVKIPEGWEEKQRANNSIENPFQVGDVVVRHYIGSEKFFAAFQIIKTTNKFVTVQKIKIENDKPILNDFINDKQERKGVKQDRQGNFVVNDGDWNMYKYVEKEQKVV